MRRALKWLGVLLASLLALLVLAAGTIYGVSAARMNRSYDLGDEPVMVPTDAASVAYGRHVATVRFCLDCHGENLGGRVVVEDPMVGRIVSSNLTSGQGGVGAVYTDADFERAIRNGVGPDGKPLIIMPSHEFYPLSDQDLGALIAYIRSIPAVDTNPPSMSIALPLRALYVLTDDINLLPAERINHAIPHPEAPPAGVTVEYGQYLAITCTGCHGEGLSGGPIPGVPPDWPPALNLTPGGQLTGWTEAVFINTMRTGITPSGYHLDGQYMPWPLLGQMTDDELKAVWLYLQSMPPKPYGNR
jgi:mono/diheme cytochrome c family protein